MNNKNGNHELIRQKKRDEGAARAFDPSRIAKGARPLSFWVKNPVLSLVRPRRFGKLVSAPGGRSNSRMRAINDHCQILLSRSTLTKSYIAE